MKKTLVALAVLGSFASVASAATSVTLYGRVDVGYDSLHHDGLKLSQDLGGVGNNMSRLGIKGEEDLGNGLAATFKLEGRFSADTGAYTKDMFDRESTVGLKGAFGAVRFGRALTAMDSGIGGFTVGERVVGFSNYSSEARHSNSAFYDYSNSGFSVGANVSTKGGAAGNSYTVDSTTSSVTTASEGANGTKVGYGLYAKYEADNFAVGAAYQRDSANTSLVSKKAVPSKEWGVGASYTFKPVTVGASYAQAKVDSSDSKTKIINAFVSGDVTPNDTVYFQYNRNKVTDKSASNAYGLGYMHSLSKRTSVYAETARTKRVAPGATEASNGWDYSVAMRHKF